MCCYQRLLKFAHLSNQMSFLSWKTAFSAVIIILCTLYGVITHCDIVSTVERAWQ